MTLNFLLLQSATVPAELPQLMVSGGVASLVLYFWRQDRKDRQAEKSADAARYEALAKDFREIVQANTRAVTQLSDALDGHTVRCPFLGNSELASRLLAAMAGEGAERNA